MVQTKIFTPSWLGTYRDDNNTYYSTSHPLLAGGSRSYNSYIGFPSSVRDAINTSSTPARVKFKFNVYTAGEFDFGAHKETYNKKSNGLPFYRYIQLAPIVPNGWHTQDITDAPLDGSTFKSKYVSGGYQGIVLYGASHAEAYGLGQGSNSPEIIVEGTWNLPPDKPTIVAPYASTVADTSVTADWNDSTDDQTTAGAMQYDVEAYDGSKWIDYGLTSNGVTSQVIDTTNFPETSSARVRVRAYDGELYSDWSYSPYFTIGHNKPPSQPTQLTPDGGTTVDSALINRLTWKHNDDGAQAQFELRWRAVGTSPWNLVDQVTTREYYNSPANTFPNDEIEWNVRTKDQQNLWSSYSRSERFFSGVPTGAPTIIQPASGSIISESNIIAKWSSADQNEVEIQLLSDTDILLWSTSMNTVSKAVSVGYALGNGKTYKLQVRVLSNTSGLWSSWTVSTFTTSFTIPSKPTFTLTENNEQGVVSLDWQEGAKHTNMVDNPNFEGGAWSNWSSTNPTSYPTVEGRGKVMRVEIIATGTGGASSPRTLTLTANQTYTLSFDARANANGKTLNYNYILSTPSSNFTIGASPSLTTEWVRYSMTFSRTTATTEGGVLLALNTAGGAVIGDWVEVDNVQIVEGSVDKPYIAGSHPNVTNVDLMRREFDASGLNPWVLLGDNFGANNSYTDYTVASELVYEYKIVVHGDNSTSIESDILEGDITLEVAFLHRAIQPSDLIIIQAEERSEDMELAGEAMYFNNRERPIFEFGVGEDTNISLGWFVVDEEELRIIKKFLRYKETLLYRDNAGRRVYCVINNLSVQDHIINGFQCSCQIQEVDFKEGV